MDKSFAMITGGSEGIGLAIARELIKAGKHVVLVARTRENLQAAQMELIALAQEHKTPEHVSEVLIEARDITDAEARLHLFATYKGKIDILINNAGFGHRAPLLDQDFDDILQPMIDLNCTAVVHLTQLFLPTLARHKGHLVNVASLLAAVPNPNYAVYAASKAFVLSFSEAVRRECQEDHVSVSVLTVLPSTITTKFFHKAAPHRIPTGGTHPEELAQAIVRAMQRRKALLVYPSSSHILIFFSRLFGWKASSRIMKYLD
jgi:short-subunit dehydrogenase